MKPFRVDQTGTYGDIRVVYMENVHLASGKNLSQLQLFFKGFMLLAIDFAHSNLKMFLNDIPEDRSAEVEILDEALRQTDTFRCLMIVQRKGQHFVIIGGRYVPLVSGLEIQMVYGDMYPVLPFIRKKLKQEEKKAAS
jgi:hypothetical protein